MRRRALISGSAAAAAAGAAHPQAPGRGPRVGVLVPGSEPASRARVAALRAGLAELGYVEPASLELLLRYADGNAERLPAIARELTATGPDVIVTSSTIALRAMVGATTTIPVVSAVATDLVGAGVVASLARPGGNVTGLTMQRLDVTGKEVELVAELVPGIARIAVLRGSAGGAAGQVEESIVAAAAARGISARAWEVTADAALEPAFAEIAAAGSQAALVIDGPFLNDHRERIAALAIARRLPVLSSSREYVESGTLASYGPNLIALSRRAAYYVDRILRGAKPADLPVEQPTTFELAINLRAARAIGLVVPQSLLQRADEVIE